MMADRPPLESFVKRPPLESFLKDDAEPSGPMSWKDVGKSALSNASDSAIGVAKSIAYPFMHPVETANTMLHDLPLGAAEKMGMINQGGQYSGKLDAIGGHLKDRYGGVENIKKTLATDPVGAAADISIPFTAGGSALARAPGVIGKVGQAVNTVGRSIDPLVGAGKVLKGAGHIGAEVVGGLGTHAGGDALRIGARAGAEGGEAAKSYLENMRANVPSEEAVNAARQGLQNMVKQRGETYRKDMAKLGLDKEILRFDKIDDALAESTKIKTYKGVDLSPSTTEIRKKMTGEIQQWRNLDPREFHTAEGLDALKKKLGDIYQATEYGTPERKAASEIYRSVRQTIIDQAPEYAKTMKAYEESEKIITQMEKTLSLNPNASVDTSLRKLQSVLRNNVNTSFGHRKELAQFLVNAGAPHLMERLAGQALQPWLPRGLGRLGAQLGAELGITGAAAAGAGGLGAGGAFLATAPFMSPRVMGETAYYAGKASPYGVPTGRASYATGRATDANYKAFQKDIDERRKRDLYQSSE